MVYELPSSFSWGIQWAVESLKKGVLPQATKPVVVPPAPMITQEQKTFLPQKPKPVDPNKTPDVFKAKFVAKYPEWVAQDGRKYKDIPAVEIVAKIVRKYPNGVTSDGIPYTDFLPRPASSSDSLEYRLAQIESLYGWPKSSLYTDGKIRWQTTGEKQFTDKVTRTQNEWVITKTAKAPFRGIESVGQNLAYGTTWVAADVVDMFDGDDKNNLSNQMRRSVFSEKWQSEILNTNKWLIWGITEGDPSSIIQTLSAGAGYLATAAKIPLYLMALSGGGNMSIEGEEQGQNSLWDKAIAYTAGGISAAIDRMSGTKVVDWLTRAGIKKETATTFVQRMNNYLKSLKPSDFEAGTEVIQQKIENIGRDLMGVDYDKGIKQYFEAGLLGKILGKVGDKWFSESPVTVLPPAPPKQPQVVLKNLDVIQNIKTWIGGNKVLKQAKSRGFDPELDIATYEDLKPIITNDGRVNTDVAQENIQNFIEPYQEKLDNAIAQEGEFIPADAFRNEILKELESEKSNIRTYKWWVSAANDAVDTAVENFGDENGNIPLSEVNNIKKKLGQNNNYTDPNITLDKTIARAAKQIVENYTKSADVKALNNDLARWYTTREYLQILGSGTKTVKGGRLWKGVARLAWVIIGSKLWPVAGMIGGEIGAKLQGKMMQWALKSTKKWIPDILSFGKIKKKQQLLLPPPSWKPTSAKVIDVKPITGFLPWLLQKSESALSRQISWGSTEGKTTQSQLVQVLGWKRKTEVVLPKKESAWKKVNNSIIR